jgi:hypothetical protein
MNKIKYLIVALLFSSFTFAACSDDDNGVNGPSAESNAFAKVIHASPDAPGVDILVDNGEATTNLTFPNNTSYLSVPSGTRNVKVNATGTSTTVIEADLDLEANIYYSIFAVNTVSNIEPLVLQDDLTEPAEGKAHVRFLHLSPDAPAVDITLTDGTKIFPDKSFKEYSEFTPLDAASYDLQVRAAGTDTVVLELNGITLEDGKIYTVFAKGLLNGSGNKALGAQIIANN